MPQVLLRAAQSIGLEGDPVPGIGQYGGTVLEGQRVIVIAEEHRGTDVDVQLILPVLEGVHQKVRPVGVTEAEVEAELVGETDGRHDLGRRGDMDVDGDLTLQRQDQSLLPEIPGGRSGVLTALLLLLVLRPALHVLLGFDESLLSQVVDAHQGGGHLAPASIRPNRVALDGHLEVGDLLDHDLVGRPVLQLHRHAGATDDVGAARSRDDGGHTAGPAHGNGRVVEVVRVQGSDLWCDGIGGLIPVGVLRHHGDGVDPHVGVHIDEPGGHHGGVQDLGTSRDIEASPHP